MKRNFCIGSNWLYYKVYTGVKTADTLLLEKIGSVILDLKESKVIDKWFFIRYKDPHEHLRIRFYSANPKMLPIVIANFYPVLNELIESDVVWKVQTDTYQREIERYGENCMEESETLFWHDSELILSYLSLKSSFVKPETELLFSILAIDNFLSSFLLTNTEKRNLMDHLQLSFKREFAASKTLKKELDKHFRELADDIQSTISGDLIAICPEMVAAVLEKQKQTKKVVLRVKSKLEISLAGFLGSHIHMMVNRQYTSKQRHYELLIYHHLYKHYKKKEYMPKPVNDNNILCDRPVVEKEFI